MSWTKCCLAQLGVLTLLLALTGCPAISPTLLVQPAAVTFGTADVATTIRIQNTGVGVLNWQAVESIPWLTMSLASGGSKQDGILSGSVSNEISVVQLFLDRSQLSQGVNNGVVNFTSNGGTQAVAVSAVSEPSALLEVSETNVDFGVASETAVFYVSNTGLAALEWTATVSTDAPWLALAPSFGAIQVGGSSTAVSLTATRGSLAAGDYTGTVTVTSNGGSATVTATMSVPSFNVQPLELPFGTISEPATQSLSLTNRGFDPIHLSIETVMDEGAGWLTATSTSPILPADSPLLVSVIANPDGLPPGTYSGRVVITATVTGFSREVPVSMNLTAVSVSPSAIDYGAISTSTQRTIQLENLGTDPVSWSVSVPQTSASWLSVMPTSGVLQTSTVLQVTANPLAVEPGTYESSLSLDFGSDQASVSVSMQRPRSASLRVEPNTIDFAASRNEILVGIWNDGLGSIDWSIDTTLFPAWLSLSPTDGSGIASGSVSGSQTDAVTLSVNRALAPEGELDFSTSFNVEASGDSTTPVEVSVSASQPRIPEIFIDSPLDNDNINYVKLASDEDSKTFYVRNDGTGTLFWSIDLSEAPTWLVSFTPSQGSLEPNTQQSVKVLIDRDGLVTPGPNYTFPIVSNDPLYPTLPFRVEVIVPPVISIGTTPSSLSFGVSVSSSAFAVANFGDTDTKLNFRITSNKDFISVYPDRGQSTGTTSPIKDWQTISISVDRSLLEGSDASAILTIEETIAEGVEPVTMDISVQASKLTIEAASPRLRIPSLVRYVLLLRNLRYQALPLPESTYPQIAQQFSLLENNTALDRAESNQMLTTINRAKTNILLLLDFSGSMQEAARAVADTDVSGAADPLLRMYQKTISELINELPDTYNIGLAVFNERGTGYIRPVREVDTDPLFTRDKGILQDRLENLHVEDNGATELLPAIELAAYYLYLEDKTSIPFDDADVRALVCVTDGRLTTPPGNITQTMQWLKDVKVRLLAVGWGPEVLADPLIRMANASGGHYYSTRADVIYSEEPEEPPTRLGVVDTLMDWCTTDTLLPEPDLLDPDYDALYEAYSEAYCDQSIAQDLKSQMIFSYTALDEESTVTVEGNLTIDDPNDQDSPCLEPQGAITGSFTSSQLDFESIAGDPRLGQISLRTEGIQADGTAEVLVRAEYIPRNISTLSFQIQLESVEALALNVVQVTKPAGGLITDWTRTGSAPSYTYTSTSGALRYGDFGDLLSLRVSGATQPFLVRFNVLYPTYIASDPNAKYFIFPDTITVTEDRFLATAFPSPYLASVPEAISDNPFTVDLGTGYNQATLNMYNLGGSHELTGQWLYAEVAAASDSRFLSVAPAEGYAVSTLTPFTFTVYPDRTLDEGDYVGSLVFTYYFLGADIDGIESSVSIRYHVLPPELTVTPLNLNFGTTLSDLQLDITNSGQGILGWTINDGLLPSWLETARASGSLGPGVTDSFNLRITRSEMSTGSYAATFDVVGDNGESFTVTVSAIVP